jgi:hypothetical protein
VSPDAEAEVIQGAYRALMRKYHPDANGGAYSDARAKRINEAYAALSDPGSRAAYDAQLRAADRSARPETAGPGAQRAGPAPERPSPKPSSYDFASTAPVPKARGKMARLSWRLTAAVTVGLAAAGFAAGRLLASTPAHEIAAVSSPSPPSPLPGGAKVGRTASASPDVATIVSREIVPRWRPDCSAATEDLVVDIQVNLARNGSLLGARLAGASGDPARLAGATERARLAVEQAAPFALPPENYRQWRVFIVRFDTRDVCAGRAEPG